MKLLKGNIKSKIYEDFTIKIVCKNPHIITSEIIEKLKNKSFNIFFNDCSSKHWIFDFKINNIWFENAKINNELTTMILYVYSNI